MINQNIYIFIKIDHHKQRREFFKKTKEAKITNLLHYLSLNKTSKEWGEIALNSKVEMRKQPRDSFISNRYDMESIVKEFIEIVF